MCGQQHARNSYSHTQKVILNNFNFLYSVECFINFMMSQAERLPLPLARLCPCSLPPFRISMSAQATHLCHLIQLVIRYVCSLGRRTKARFTYFNQITANEYWTIAYTHIRTRTHARAHTHKYTADTMKCAAQAENSFWIFVTTFLFNPQPHINL